MSKEELTDKIKDILISEGLGLMTGEVERQNNDPVVIKLLKLFSQEYQTEKEARDSFEDYIRADEKKWLAVAIKKMIDNSESVDLECGVQEAYELALEKIINLLNQ